MVLQVTLVGIDMIMRREELALDQIGLDRRAQAPGDIGLALGEVEFVIVHHQMQFDLRIFGQELRQARQQPIDADAVAGGDFQRAARAFMDILERFLGGGQPVEHVAHGAEQKLAFVGEGQAAGMALEQRRGDSSSSALIWRLTADCERPKDSPAWVKLPADATAWKMRSLSQSIEAPLHQPPRAVRESSPPCEAARKRSASSAAMQPMPAAVTAWRNILSLTSPAAKTPAMLVCVESGAVLI